MQNSQLFILQAFFIKKKRYYLVLQVIYLLFLVFRLSNERLWEPLEHEGLHAYNFNDIPISQKRNALIISWQISSKDQRNNTFRVT